MSNDAEFEKFIQEIKDKADLVEVIERTSEYRFGKRTGRYTKCIKPDSLMVDIDWGVYTWFAKSGEVGKQFESGDAFHWLERYNSMGFWDAALYLAQMYNVRVPDKVRQVDPEKAKAQKTRQETWEIACQWFERQLWASPAALDYCHRRGWTDETIRTARLGFAPGYEALPDLRGDMTMNEVNLDDAATVAIIGRRGGVAAWITAQGIQDANPDWISSDYVPGLAGGLRLVYPHIWRGRVVYFSARNLLLDGERLVNRPDKDEQGSHKPKSYNLPRSLAGERVRYFNFAFTRGAKSCLVVEGQPDAISAAQAGLAGVALAGVAADANLVELIKAQKIERVFMGLDNDKAGQANQVNAAAQFGPMTRLVSWPSPTGQDDSSEEQAADNDDN